MFRCNSSTRSALHLDVVGIHSVRVRAGLVVLDRKDKGGAAESKHLFPMVVIAPFAALRWVGPASMEWYVVVWYRYGHGMGVVWYGMMYGYGIGLVWYGMGRYGTVWYGMVWFSLVWYGVV